MTKRKLPPATDWRARNIDDWNTLTFTEYLKDKHREMFGCEYAPMRNWGFEQGVIGRLIGTKRKKGTHDKAVVKAFIDEAFETYKPTPKYPGTNFGFIYTYRRNILQRLEVEHAQEKERKRREAERETEDFSDVFEWL